MSSIIPSNINGNFPVYGQNNATQGFRDNFTNIKTNFTIAKSEIEDLQNKAILKSSLTGTTLDNDLNGSILTNPQLRAWTQTFIDLGELAGNIDIDFNIGNFQKITTSGNVNISIINWPASQGVGVTGYAVMRVWFVIASAGHTVQLPSEVNIGTNDLANFDSETNSLRFDVAGNFVFDISSADGGENYLIFDNTRNRVRFRDPSFYFNPDVSPTLLIGFQDVLPLAVQLARTSDTIQIRGSMTSYGGILEHGNQPGLGVYNVIDGQNVPPTLDPALAGNANVAGYSVATSRAYLDPLTGLFTTDSRALVNSNDYLGYFNFLALSHDPTFFPFDELSDLAQGAFAEFASMRSFAVGSFGNIVPGGNLVLMTKRDGVKSPYTGYLHPALSLENDQSAHLYGGTVNYGGEALNNYAYVNGDTQTSFTVTPNTPVVIIDSGNSSTIASMTITPPPTVNARDGQKFTLSAAANVTACSVVTFYDTVFLNEVTIPPAIPGFPATTILTIPANNLLQPGLVITTAFNPSGEYISNQVVLSVLDNHVELGPFGTANVIISAPADSSAIPTVTSLKMLSASTMNLVPTSLTTGDSWTWIFKQDTARWYKI